MQLFSISDDNSNLNQIWLYPRSGRVIAHGTLPVEDLCGGGRGRPSDPRLGTAAHQPALGFRAHQGVGGGAGDHALHPHAQGDAADRGGRAAQDQGRKRAPGRARAAAGGAEHGRRAGGRPVAGAEHRRGIPAHRSPADRPGGGSSQDHAPDTAARLDLGAGRDPRGRAGLRVHLRRAAPLRAERHPPGEHPLLRGRAGHLEGQDGAGAGGPGRPALDHGPVGQPAAKAHRAVLQVTRGSSPRTSWRWTATRSSACSWPPERGSRSCVGTRSWPPTASASPCTPCPTTNCPFRPTLSISSGTDEDPVMRAVIEHVKQCWELG